MGFMRKGNKSPLIIKVKLAKRRILFFLSASTYNLQSIEISLVRFGYINKRLNLPYSEYYRQSNKEIRKQARTC